MVSSTGKDQRTDLALFLGLGRERRGTGEFGTSPLVPQRRLLLPRGDVEAQRSRAARTPGATFPCPRGGLCWTSPTTAPSVPQRRAWASLCPRCPREPRRAELEHGVLGISLLQLATH